MQPQSNTHTAWNTPRFDIVLSNIPGAIPLATIMNMTNVARNPGFQAGDSWRPDVQDASAGSHVYLHLWKDNTDLGRSGLYGNPTDATGAWTIRQFRSRRRWSLAITNGNRKRCITGNIGSGRYSYFQGLMKQTNP
jgi:hypothetical protein